MHSSVCSTMIASWIVVRLCLILYHYAVMGKASCPGENICLYVSNIVSRQMNAKRTRIYLFKAKGCVLKRLSLSYRAKDKRELAFHFVTFLIKFLNICLRKKEKISHIDDEHKSFHFRAQTPDGRRKKWNLTQT